jgi:hypothetical protein
MAQEADASLKKTAEVGLRLARAHPARMFSRTIAPTRTDGLVICLYGSGHLQLITICVLAAVTADFMHWAFTLFSCEFRLPLRFEILHRFFACR